MKKLTKAEQEKWVRGQAEDIRKKTDADEVDTAELEKFAKKNLRKA